MTTVVSLPFSICPTYGSSPISLGASIRMLYFDFGGMSLPRWSWNCLLGGIYMQKPPPASVSTALLSFPELMSPSPKVRTWLHFIVAPSMGLPSGPRTTPHIARSAAALVP